MCSGMHWLRKPSRCGSLSRGTFSQGSLKNGFGPSSLTFCARLRDGTRVLWRRSQRHVSGSSTRSDVSVEFCWKLLLKKKHARLTRMIVGSTNWSGALVSLALRLPQFVRRSEEDPSLYRVFVGDFECAHGRGRFSSWRSCVSRNILLSLTR